MSEKGYNGWTNFATWGCKLILDNDCGLYDQTQEMAREAAKIGGRESVYKLEVELREFVGELCGLESPGEYATEPSDMAKQLLGAAMCEVNWREIAESLLNDLDDE